MDLHLVPRRRGIPGQDPIFALNEEAQRRKARGEPVVNATVGALLDDEGRLVILETVQEVWKELTPMEVAPYAPIAGDPAYLQAILRRAFPAASPGAACATPGGSGALALSVRNFLDPGMEVLAAAPLWGPYRTLAAENGAGLAEAPWPGPGEALDLDAWRRKAEELLARQGRLLIWLNDPCQNPSGRSLSRADREALGSLLLELSGRGPVTLLLDQAYLDYTTDPAHVREALEDYERLGREGRVLVGAALSLSKALTLYGARAGALVFPWTSDPDIQAALSVSCRGSFSNVPRAPQSLLARLSADPARLAALKAEHAHWSAVIQARARALDGALRSEGLPGAAWTGGFFTALSVADAAGVCERLRTAGVFVVPLPTGMRVGLCGLAERDAPVLAHAMKVSLSAC